MNGCSSMHLTIFGLNTVVKHASAELRQGRKIWITKGRPVQHGGDHR
jgi:hypothetical protein